MKNLEKCVGADLVRDLKLTREEEILAKTIYGEARGELFELTAGFAGLMAVGNVVMNRVQDKRKRFGVGVEGVCLRPKQFSCWNDFDRNRELLDHAGRDREVFLRCVDAATGVLTGRFPDLTRGALWYHATTLVPEPSFVRDGLLKKVFLLGGHVFYAEGKAACRPS